MLEFQEDYITLYHGDGPEPGYCPKGLQSNWPYKDEHPPVKLPDTQILIDDENGVTVAEYANAVQARDYMKRVGRELNHSVRIYQPNEAEHQKNLRNAKTEKNFQRGY